MLQSFQFRGRAEPYNSSGGSSSDRCQGHRGEAFAGTLKEESLPSSCRSSGGGGGGSSRGWGSREGSRSLTPPAVGRGGPRHGRGGGSAHSSPAKDSLLRRSNGPEVGFLRECVIIFRLSVRKM